MGLTLNAYSKVDFKNFSAESTGIPSHTCQKFIYLGKQAVQEDEEKALTQHALRLSESSLKEDWENEDDNHWDRFLE